MCENSSESSTSCESLITFTSVVLPSCCASPYIDPEQMVINTKQFLDALAWNDLYRYIANADSKTGSKNVFFCQQRLHQYQRCEEEVRETLHGNKRQWVSHKSFDRGREVSFLSIKTKQLIRLKHRSHHNTSLRSELNSFERTRDEQCSEGGMLPFQIITVLRADTNEAVLYIEVYNMWLSVLERSFKWDTDPVNSAVRYLKQCKQAKIVLWQKDLIGYGFVTTIGKVICNKFRVDKALMDSTYKTNEQKLELFVTTLSKMGVGFSAAIFFLQAGTSRKLKTREAFLAEFPWKTGMALSNLKPQFFFSRTK